MRSSAPSRGSDRPRPLAPADLNAGGPALNTAGLSGHHLLQLFSGNQRLGKDTENSLSRFHL
jgi:hypothetical protein